MNWLHHAMLCYLGAGSAGEDEIVADEQNGGEVMIDCWRTNQLPSEWKKSILVPMHKEDRKVCNNYCGTSLLSILGLMLSLVLLDRLDHS